MSPETLGPTLAALSDYLVDLEFAALPPAVVERERWHLLDTLGCGLYGATTPWVTRVRRALDRLGERGSAALLGTDRSLSPARAALVNGTAVHSMDFDDHCKDAGVHAGSALAYADAADRTVSGREFLTAMAAGVEVGIRSGFGVGYGSVARGWHIAGWTGAFASAATTGVLFGLDRERQGHALAVAGSQGCGLLGAQYGADVKRFHMGKAAEAGYLGAALAREGFTGDARIFGERYGAVGPTMSDDYDVDAVTAGLGDEYRLLDKLAFKPFPSVGQVHAPVDAVRAILDREGLDPGDVTSVTVRTTQTVKDHVGWDYVPADVMSAQANVQYAVAALLVDGEVTVDAYTETAIARESIVARIDDVAVVVDESLADETFGAVAVVEAGGERYEAAVETPRGYPENPMSPADLEAKFRRQAGHALDDDAVDRVVELVADVESLDDVAVLVDALGG